jgi:hypothetical protein
MTRLTVEPMLRLIGGLFVAASVLLGIYVSPHFLWFALFVGLNLAQSGVSGWCPMVWFLKKCHVPEQMPRVHLKAGS